MFEVADLLAGLELEDVGDGRFRAPNMDFYAKSSGGAASQAVSDVVAGGQLLSQAIVATTVSQPGKTVKSIHAVFARSGRVSVPMELQVDTLQSGRTLGTSVVTFMVVSTACDVIFPGRLRPSTVTSTPPGNAFSSSCSSPTG